MIQKRDVSLDSMPLWEQHAPPKRGGHWKEYRSAWECARAWLDAGGSQIPTEIVQVLSTHEDFGAVREWSAEPECHVHFDGFKGPANVDMLLSASDEQGRFVVAIEAKADERFGPFVSNALARAVERWVRNPGSQGVTRIQQLVARILGPAKKGAPRLWKIRYQLLTTVAAALARADEEGVDRAVVMIHEFRTPLTKPRRHVENAEDLARFLVRLGVAEPGSVENGRLLGPLRVASGAPTSGEVRLYIGKAKREVALRPAENGA